MWKGEAKRQAPGGHQKKAHVPHSHGAGVMGSAQRHAHPSATHPVPSRPAAACRPGATRVARRRGGPSWPWLQARTHLEAGLALNEALRHHAPSLQDNQDLGVMSRSYLVWILWLLGYPEQALRRSRDNLIRARELERPISLVHTLSAMAALHRFRREGRLTQEQAEAAMALATEHGLPFFAAWRTPGCVCWTKCWPSCPRRGCSSTRQSCTDSPGCCSSRRAGRWAVCLATRRAKHGFSRPSPSPGSSRPGRWSCGRPRV
jgi:hypothetical protein